MELRLKEVSKVYSNGRQHLALRKVSLAAKGPSIVGLTGPSGSGKSTLINIIAGIDRPTTGEVLVNGVRVDDKPESWLVKWRRENVGIVFQFFHLIPTLTALENVMLPMYLAGRPSKRRAIMLLEEVGIGGSLRDKFPYKLSGGEQQRVAFARALANDPPIILADEPTGNLDSVSSEVVMDLLSALGDEKLVIVATHNLAFLKYFDRVVRLKDGSVHSVEERG